MNMNDKKLNELLDNKEFVEKMMSQETPEDVHKFLEENGVNVTLDEVYEFGKELEKYAVSGDELTEENLEGVAGGSVTVWAVIKVVTAIGSAGLSIYKWYKSR